MDLGFGELLDLRRHLVGLAVVDHRDDRSLAVAMQPDVVRQVGRTDGLIALAIGTVTGGTHHELRFAQRSAQRIVRTAGQAQDIVGQVLDIIGRANRCCPISRLATTACVSRRYD